MRRLISKLVILALAALGLASCANHSSDAHQTVSAYAQWAETLEEYPAPDNEDFLNPDYSSFHESRKPSWLKRTFMKRPIWTPATFSTLLNETVKNRLYSRLRAPHVVAIRPNPGSHIYVWGDLMGAFHSLMRDLLELKRRKIIDDNFKIQGENTYFVFNGNQIDRSPYNLETLSIIMRLMKVNDGKVIYVAGRHELKGVWHDYGTARELALRTEHDVDMDKLLEVSPLNIFFETLPLSLFIIESEKSVKKEMHVMEIFAHEHSVEVPENKIIDPLSKAVTIAPTVIFLDKEYKARKRKLVPDAMLRAISRSTTYRVTQGLDLVEPENGAISWTSLSSPTLTFQKLFQFSNDAFVDLQINSSIKNSIISLNAQNAVKKKGFATRIFHLLSGKELTPQEAKSPALINDYHIRFGSTFDLSGASSILGQRVMSGVDLRLRKANRALGIDKELIRFYMLDDKSSPSRAMQNVQLLIDRHDVHTLIAPVGTDTTEALLPQVKKGQLTIFFPNSGSDQLRNPNLKNLINLRTSFANEACALVRYAKETLFKHKFAIVYQDDNFGKEPLAAAKRLLKKRYKTSDEDICEVAYEPNSLDMSLPAQRVLACLPDTILFLSTLTAAQALIHEVGIPFLGRTTILGLSFMTDAFRSYSDSKALGTDEGKGLHFVISRVVPNPMDTSLEVVRNYKKEMDSEYPGARHNADSLEAYISASLIVHGMDKIEPPVTTEKLMKQLENLKDYDHQGLKLNFDPQTRELSDHLWLDTGDEKWIEQPPAHSLCNPGEDVKETEPESYPDTTPEVR